MLIITRFIAEDKNDKYTRHTQSILSPDTMLRYAYD